MSNPATVATTTPPDSFTSPPLTPPPSEEKQSCLSISQILSTAKHCQKGSKASCPHTWQRFALQEDEYRDLLQEVAKGSEIFRGFWKHKLRHDYFPSTSTFVLRMPSATHEQFIESITGEISRSLRTLASADADADADPPCANFARQINSHGSASIYFADDYGRHDPDGAFGHRGALFPGVVLEVSYSQKRRDLSRLADDYILGSDGSIKAVVGLDIEYQGKGKGKGNEKGSKLATLSVWRPKITRGEDGEGELSAYQEVVDLEFRNKDGMANSSPDAGLTLHLADFAPDALLPNPPPPQHIFIPAATLTRFLIDAENTERMIKDRSGVKQTVGKWTKKRRRDSTPAEELDSAKEEMFREDEVRAEKRVMNRDRAYRGRKSKGGDK